MRIWIDADACPNAIKEVLFRAANRTKTTITLVSGQMITTPPSPFITKLQVKVGLDAADDKIIQSVESGDLVITADIPLADAVVAKGCMVINPRGELYTAKNIKERLSVRNFSDSLRGSGVVTGGPPKFSNKEVQQFSNKLDQILRKLQK